LSASGVPPGLDEGLTAVREFLGPDGAELEVTDWDAPTGTLAVRLVLDSAECAECVIPRPMLDTLLVETLRTHAPEIQLLDLDDPRDG
jgi:hypothetical protein